jgi:hypothetical protein
MTKDSKLVLIILNQLRAEFSGCGKICQISADTDSEKTVFKQSSSLQSLKGVHEFLPKLRRNFPAVKMLVI